MAAQPRPKWIRIDDDIPDVGAKMPYKTRDYVYNNCFSIRSKSCWFFLFYTFPEESTVHLYCRAHDWLPDDKAEELFARKHEKEILFAVETLRKKIWEEEPTAKSTCVQGEILVTLVPHRWTNRNKSNQAGSGTLQKRTADLISKPQRLLKKASKSVAEKVSVLQYIFFEMNIADVCLCRKMTRRFGLRKIYKSLTLHSARNPHQQENVLFLLMITKNKLGLCCMI
jgi:hypothetical protein